MPRPLPSLLTACLFTCSVFLTAQNVGVTYQNPVNFSVCGSAAFSVTIKNNQSASLANLTVTTGLPAGITYVPGTVSTASEGNISNLSAPVFNLPDLTAGASVSFTLTVFAGCAAIDAINSGILFTNSITTNFDGGSQQVTTQAYPVETGLLLISTVNPSALSGLKGQTLTRTIKLRNTRQGAIGSLHFSDMHTTGVSISLSGLTGANVTDSVFEADVPGSFFANFGDGDPYFEFNEEVTLTELLTITECKAKLIPSNIKASWGCGLAGCQQDSAVATVEIKPTTVNPMLEFIRKYAPSQSICGETPAVQELLIANTGTAAAEYANISLRVIDSLLLGIDYGSIEINTGSGWVSLTPVGGLQQPLPGCSVNEFYRLVSLKIPPIPAGDTIRLRFSTYTCLDACSIVVPRFGAVFSYPELCPENKFVSGGFTFDPLAADSVLKSKVYFNIGHCLENDSVYPLNYWIKAGRLLQDNGFLQVVFDLPPGLSWETDCFKQIGGKAPVSIENTVSPPGNSQVRVVFALPFSSDSVFGALCLRYHCLPDLPCGSSVPNFPPRGASYTVFPPGVNCIPCELNVQVHSYFTPTTAPDLDCAVSACDEFILSADNSCDPGGGGGGGGGGSSGGGTSLPDNLSTSYDVYRLNVGLRDDNDDRNADSNDPPTLSKIRRDRFITGDTLRTEFQAIVLEGTFSQFALRQFHESWASDFGVAEGDTFELLAAQPGFVNFDTTALINRRLILKLAGGGGAVECPFVFPPAQSDQHIFTIAEPNIRPYVIHDQVASMFNQFELRVAGCLPGVTELHGGDTLLFIADYQFKQNFMPPSKAVPPLVNFRNSICLPLSPYGWKLPWCVPPRLLQFSGVLQDIEVPKHTIRPCENSDELSPFLFSLRLARGNLFPFEVRQLATILDYSQGFPQGVPITSTRLRFLQLQENKTLFADQDLLPIIQGNTFHLNLSPYFSKPLDEGYRWLLSTVYGPFCQYTGNKSAPTTVQVKYANECLHKPLLANLNFLNLSGFQNGSPILQLSPPGIALDLTYNTVVLNLSLANLGNYPAPNTWLTVNNTGSLDDMQLQYMPSGLPVTRTGGLWQLGTWPPPAGSGKDFLQLIARNKSCDTKTLHFAFGWDCEPVTNPGGDICGIYDTIIELRPQRPELELVIKAEPESVPMCAPSDWFEFQVYNANVGYAYALAPSVKLPPGLRVVAGSSQLSYPDGAQFLPMPDPAVLPGNVWQWNPQAASAVLDQVGLAGFNKEPFHAIRIRFRVEALCSAVSNTQIIYQAEGLLPCGIHSNVLRKPGEPVLLNNLEPSYGVTAQLGFANPPGAIVCGGTTELVATLSLDGASSPGDSIYVLLPPGVVYVNGSYTAEANAPAGPPNVSGQTLRWPIPSPLGIGTTIRFRFGIRYDNPAGCADQVVILQTREQTQAFCASSGHNCDVYVATGETYLTLNLQNPQLTIQGFQPVFENGTLNFTAELKNAGLETAVNPFLEFYLDLNQNNTVDAGDQLLSSVQLNQLLAPGASTGLLGILNLDASDLCRLLAYLPGASNCACTDQTIPLGGDVSTLTSISLCESQPVSIGVDSIAGNTYHWLSTTGLNCTTCAQVTYTPGGNQQPGAIETVVLQEITPNCTIEHHFDIRIGVEPGLETPDQTVCRGAAATLVATPGGSYQWSGPGITDPGSSVQIVTPASDAVYSVTVTFFGGCTGTGSVRVTVLESDSIDLGTLTTCAGTPVSIFGMQTEEPGMYAQTLQNAYGCDSTLFIRLLVTPALTLEDRPLCPGASTLVFDSLFTAPGSLCREFQSSAGCDSTHCVIVKPVPGPQLDVPDTIIIEIGQQIQLNAETGFIQYQWSPGTGLSCTNCPDPLANPQHSTTYWLTVTDGNGCIDSVIYRLLVFPPCDPQRIRVPNSFTPNGDGYNDVFETVPVEGFERIRSLSIYNRWGQRIYSGNGANAVWDGRVDGKPAPTDVYVWILEVDCTDGVGKRVGDVTLIR